jgi:hypothetical protein
MLWYFDVFYSVNDNWKSDYHSRSIKKSKQQSTYSFTNYYCSFRILLLLNYNQPMPANSKYLTPAFWPRFAKITAAILGGYLVSTTFHLALASWFNRPEILMTMAFSGFILWVVLMVVAFLAKSGWKIWGIYILLSLVFSLLIYLGQTYNPAV